jgi:H+/Cl- antiporter ClcA
LVLKVFSTYDLTEIIIPIDREHFEVNHGWRYVFYAILGILCGILGSALIQVISKLIYLRTKLKAPFISNRWKLCFTVGLITAACTYCVTFLRTPDKALIRHFFSQKSLSDQDETDWLHPNITFNLFIFVIIKFILQVLAISSPI